MKQKKSKDNFFLLRLYVAGESSSSLKAISNLNAICEEYLPDRHEIEIVDTLDKRAAAFEDGILVTPTLVKIGPLPMRQIIGDLSDKPKLLSALGDLTGKTLRNKQAFRFLAPSSLNK